MRYLLLILTAYFCLGAYLDESKTTNVNLLSNPGFEQGIARWTNSGGGTLTRETGSNVGVGDSSGAWDASAASDTLTSEQVTIPTGLQNRFCSASFIYKGGDANLTAEVIDGSLAVLASQVLSAQTDFQAVDLAFTCPSSGTLAIRINASADAAIIYLEQAFIGKQSSSVSHSVSPTVYSLSKQSAGEAGIIDNTRGSLTESFFPDSTDLQFWSLNGDTNGDAAASPINLTQNGSPVFDISGIFGGNILRTTGATSGAYSDNVFFQVDPATDDFSMAMWVGGGIYNDASSTYTLGGIGDPGGSAMFQLEVQGALARIADNAGLTFSTSALTTGERYHFAYTYDASASTKYFYLNGELVASHVGALTNVANERFTIGVGRSLTGGKANSDFQELFFKKTLLTDAEIKSLFSRRYDGKQVALGHVLTDDSFPAYTTDISYYNLTSLSDDSTNSRNLTNNNSVTFAGTDIFGVSGIAEFNGTNSLDSASTFFTDGLNGRWVIGGLYRANDWRDAGTLISIWDGSPNRGPRIETFSGNILFSASETGSDAVSISIPVPIDFYNGSRHHLALAYDGRYLIAYIDGKRVGSTPFAGQASITATFSIGSRYVSGTPGGYFTGGVAQAAFFASKGLNDAEIARLASARIDHNKSVPVADQTWTGTFYNELNDIAGEFDQDWIAHKTQNSIFLDLGLLPEQFLNLKLKNDSFSATTIPAKTFTTGLLSSAPSFPINTGLPCDLQDFYVRTEGQSLAGQFDKRFDLLSASGNILNGDVSSLTIDASHRLEIVAGCVAPALSFNLDEFDLLITNDTLSQDLFVNTGKTLFRPNLEISSGSTLTVDGTFNTVGEITGLGTLQGSGTVSSIDEQSVFAENKTFQSDVTVGGKLTGNVETTVPVNASCGAGNVCSGVENLGVAVSSGTCTVSVDRGSDKWMRVGNVVSIAYKFDFTNITTSTCGIDFDLPAAAQSNFESSEDASCTVSNNNVYFQPLTVTNAVDNKIRVFFGATSGTHGGSMGVNCMYEIQPNI